jgi:hypothetical protein
MAYIVVDVPREPELPLPSGMRNVVLNNRLTDSLKLHNYKRDYVLRGSGKDAIISVAAIRVIKGLEENIIDGYRFDFKGDFLLATLDSGLNILQPPVSEKLITGLCEKADGDVLLSLESVDYHTSVKYESFMAKEPKDPKKMWTNTITYDVRRVEYFNAKMIVNIELGWRIYDGNTGKIIYQGYQKDSTSYEVQGKSKEEANKKLPSVISAVEKAGYIAGMNVLKRISPAYTTVERYYYKNPNSDFNKAYQLVKFRRWEDAAKYWEPYLHSDNLKIKAKAAYNMALVAELHGDLKLAHNLIKEAGELWPGKDVEAYRRIIEERLVNKY